jgi:hypothetical protein
VHESAAEHKSQLASLQVRATQALLVSNSSPEAQVVHVSAAEHTSQLASLQVSLHALLASTAI